MLTNLLIRDKTTASLGKTDHTFAVHVSGEMINQRVAQELEEYSDRKPAVFHMLVQPNNKGRTLNSFRFHQPRQVDLVTQFETEIAFLPDTSITVRNSFRLPTDRKKWL